ncbi:MAG: hypothetical protein Rubg2KO_24050 [Rubricoccaceae bacterium]
MTRTRSTILLNALGVAGTAAFVGNMLTIGLGFGGYWQSLDPTALMAWFSENFFRFLIPTVMSVLPFSLVGLGASVWLARGDRPTQRTWAGALGCVVVACLITAVYHLPANLALASQAMSPDEASATLSTWLLLHWMRVAFALVAAGLSLEAFRRSAQDA